MIDEAWVTYADGGYFGLMDVLLRSLAAFSTRSVLVYGIRDDYHATSTNVVDVRRIDSPDHIWTLKMSVMLDAAPRAERLIFLDSDSVANYSADQLWGWFDVQQNRSELPLLHEHTDSAANPAALQYERSTGERIDRPFGCTSLIWYTAECVPLLEEARELKRRVEQINPEIGDSEAINAVLAVRGYTVNAPLCTPYYMRAEDYLNGRIPAREHMHDAHELCYHVFHGCKDAGAACRLLAELIKSKRLPVHYIEAQ
jgi:hypothetical protein